MCPESPGHRVGAGCILRGGPYVARWHHHGVAHAKFPLLDAYGEPYGVGGITIDITPRVRAEAAVRLSERRFRSIVENSDAGYFFLDRDGVIRDVNRAWVEMYRYDSADEIVGKHFAAIQRLEDVERAKELGEGIRRGDSEYLSGEFSRQCKDGTIGFHTFSARPVIHAGETIGIEGFIIDTTASRRVEEALRESESAFRDLVSTINDLVFTVDAEGNILYVNSAATAFTGREPEVTIGHDFGEYVEPRDLPRLLASMYRSRDGDSEESAEALDQVAELRMVKQNG